jgi:hypothetical protein
MELDQPALQWLFNVVTITGFTSLVVLCYVLKKENQKLTLELAHTQLRDEHSEITIRASTGAGSISEQKTGPTELPLEHQDIRNFVARRSRDWFTSAPNKGTV